VLTKQFTQLISFALSHSSQDPVKSASASLLSGTVDNNTLHREVVDDFLCRYTRFQPLCAFSYTISPITGSIGMFLSQGIVKRYEILVNHSPANELMFPKGLYRFGALYCTAFSVVLVWRGAWLSWDCFYEGLHSTQAWHASKSSFLHHSVYHHLHEEEENVDATDPGHATKSGLFSHLTAIGLLLSMGTFASVMAPPAAISILHDKAVKSSVRAVVNQTTRKPLAKPAYRRPAVRQSSISKQIPFPQARHTKKR